MKMFQDFSDWVGKLELRPRHPAAGASEPVYAQVASPHILNQRAPRSRAANGVLRSWLSLIVLTTDLILADYLASFGSFMVATITALVVGKSVLVANAIPFLRRFDTAPMIQPVLFKTIVYWAVVFLVRFLEKLVEYLFAGGNLSAIPEYVATHFTWHRFAAIQIWIFVLFLIYTSVEELNARLGDGELMKILLQRRFRH
jgi:hypothetical protein